jgi:transcriptional regulator
MYVPKNMQMDDNQCQRFIKDYPFALLMSENPLQGTHLPVVYHPQIDGLGYFHCHMARANGQWKSLDQQLVTLVFSGPHAYISPHYYQQSPAVPTWNYAAVHVQAKARQLEMQQNASITNELLDIYEPQHRQEDNIYAPDYVAKLNQMIVSFRLDIIAMQGKLKLGQQRSEVDQISVFEALNTSKRNEDRQLAQFMDDWNTANLLEHQQN